MNIKIDDKQDIKSVGKAEVDVADFSLSSGSDMADSFWKMHDLTSNETGEEVQIQSTQLQNP